MGFQSSLFQLGNNHLFFFASYHQVEYGLGVRGISLGNYFSQKWPYSFVEQNSPPVANFFGHNSPTGSNPISQISPAPTVFGQTSSKTLLLTGPSVQPFHPTTPVGQIDRLPFDQNKARHAPQSFRESRHILFNGHGFEDENEEEEIDRPSERIFRGWELDPHEFPWMVKLMVRTALSAKGQNQPIKIRARHSNL